MTGINPNLYFKILGVDLNATPDQIKRAYRKKARLYHPDLNKRKDAAELFIAVNEAYEYLIAHSQLGNFSHIKRENMTEAWHSYRREEARKRAYRNSRERYNKFTKSQVYKTSMVLNKVQLFINLSVSVLVISMAIIGYIMKWRMVEEGYDPPTLEGFIFLLSIGLLFFLVSMAHILAFYQNKNKIGSYEKKN